MPLPAEQRDNQLARQVIAEAQSRSLERYLLHEPLVLGVSGGADSLAMLHLLRAIRGEKAASTLHVAHLNHWFRGKEAQEDADYVRDIALAWGINCTVETFDVPNYARRHKLSAEDAARRVRYSFLAAIARDRGATVAVAHNADDQVETVLMSILRGTGIGGLAGMQMLSTVPLAAGDDKQPAFTPPATGGDGSVPLFRPLLHVWRHEIVTYCQQHKLEPRFDATNWERIYRRNRVRHDLIPHLQLQYSLAVKDHLYNLAEIAQAENQFLDSIVEQEWARSVQMAGEGREVHFDSEKFASLPTAMRRRLARRAIEVTAGTLQDITFEQIEAVAAILCGDPVSPAAMHLPHGLVARRTKGSATIARRERAEPLPEEVALWPMGSADASVPVTPGMQLALFGGWRFTAELFESGQPYGDPGELAAIFDYAALAQSGSLTLRTRLQGDHIHPMGMQGAKSLQDLMVDAKIPRELRDRIPIVAVEGTGEALWVPGRGGRRSCHAPLSEATGRVLRLEFIRE